MRTVSFPTQSFNPVICRAGMDSTQAEGTSEGEEPQSARTGATPLVSQDHLLGRQTAVAVELHRQEPGDVATGQQEETSDGRQADQPAPSGHQSPEQGECVAAVTSQSPANGGVLEPPPVPSYAQEVYTMDKPPLYDLYAMTVSVHTQCAHAVCYLVSLLLVVSALTIERLSVKCVY